MNASPRKTRVLMLLLEFHPIFTGHGIYLQQLCRRLREQGHEVSFLVADYGTLPARESVDGFEVYRFPFSHGEQKWELKLALRVIRFLATHRDYDVLHIHGHLDVYGLLTLYNLFTGKHTVSQMVLLGADDPLTLLRVYRFMRARFRILCLMDRFICISRVLGESYRQAGLPPEKLAYIPQGVDVLRFTPLSGAKEREALKDRLGLSRCERIVVFVGAVVERKGVDLLIEAWSRVQREFPGAQLVLVGQHEFDANDVNMRRLNGFVDAVTRRIETEGLRVLLAGRRSNVEEYLQVADLFVLPSRKEGFGNVILEAMACALPVVVTEMDGVARETVVEGENGYIAGSVDELARHIAALLGDPALAAAMGAAGRRRAEESFSMELIASRYAELYRQIVRGTP